MSDAWAPASVVEGIKSAPFVCVCVSCLPALPRQNCRTNGPEISYKGVDLDNIFDEFESQGHRSKFKAAYMKNVIFILDGLT